MAHVLAIGPFNASERAGLADGFAAEFLDAPGEMGASDAISAVAYKGHAPFGAVEMDKLPGLKLVANYGVGYDAIDVAAATARGIRVTNTPDVLSDDVADLAIALLIMQAREMEQASAYARTGHWVEKGEYPLTRKISGGTAGIVGLGRIGREIAARLAGFKMDVHYWSRSERDAPGLTYHSDPVALAAAVDVLFVALVGGPDTDGFVGKDMLAALGPRGILVNISRGSCVDEAALLDALEAGGIAGAGLDVFQNEPKIDPRFYALDNVVIQPHLGSATVETRAAMAKLQRDNIRAHLDGAPLLTPVN